VLKNFLHWEILLFTTSDWSWTGFILVGLLLGVFIRLFAVRRKSEFKGVFTGICCIWFGLHIINLLFVTNGITGLATLLMSALSALAPVSTFMVFGFLLTHMVKSVKDEI